MRYSPSHFKDILKVTIVSRVAISVVPAILVSAHDIRRHKDKTRHNGNGEGQGSEHVEFKLKC